MNIYSFQSYLDIVVAFISENNKQSAYKGKLAQAANCQPAYLSQVLSGKAHFTPDHAANLCSFFKFDPFQSTYFINLVHLARASSPRLKAFIMASQNSILSNVETVSGRVKTKPAADEDRLKEYYSSWHYSAVHIATTCPSYQTVERISDRLSLSQEKVELILNRLESLQLVQNQDQVWRAINYDLHISDQSELNVKNHVNWRLKALENIQSNQSQNNIHYTAVFSMSEETYKSIKNKVLEMILETRNQIISSKEEDVFVMNCDFFKP